MGGNSGLYQEMSWNKKNTSAPFNTLLGVINFTPKRILQFNITDIYLMEKLFGV